MLGCGGHSPSNNNSLFEALLESLWLYIYIHLLDAKLAPGIWGMGDGCGVSTETIVR